MPKLQKANQFTLADMSSCKPKSCT